MPVTIFGALRSIKMCLFVSDVSAHQVDLLLTKASRTVSEDEEELRSLAVVKSSWHTKIHKKEFVSIFSY